MAKEILDDADDGRIKITTDQLWGICIILFAFFWIWQALSEWYEFYHPTVLVFFRLPEKAYALKLLAAILICFYGIQLFLKKRTVKSAMLRVVLTFLGIEVGILFLL